MIMTRNWRIASVGCLMAAAVALADRFRRAVSTFEKIAKEGVA
jgi:hypothetical protein